MTRIRQIIGNLVPIATVIALLLMVGLLPPDTSLSEVQRIGTLKVCVPTAYPPLVTGDAAKPGIDVEILQAVAAKIGVRLAVNENPAMGRDFNPRNWRLTRGACEVIAGGVVDTNLTRSFLETSPFYAVTGWATVSPLPLEGLGGRKVAVLALISGLDRQGLSSYLRANDISVRVMPAAPDFVTAIASGEVDAGITEALLGASLADPKGWTVALMPPELVRYRLVFGLWKGDLTLKRSIVQALGQLEADGTLAAILGRYGVQRVGTIEGLSAL